MSLEQFYYSIFLKFDKKLGKNLELAIKRASLIEEKPSPVQLKSLFADALGVKVLDSFSSKFIETTIENTSDVQFTFAHVLKNLALYPLESDIFKNWNRHVELFDLAERSNYSEETIVQLHQFLLEITEQKNNSQFFTFKEIQKPFHNIMLLIVHLDTLISLHAGFEPLSFNQYLKFRQVKDKPYYPSKNFSDILLFLLGTKFKRKFIQYIPKVTELAELIDGELLGEGIELNDLDEETKQQREQKNDEFIQQLKQLIKKMREGKRFCYLSDIDQFFTTPFNLKATIKHPLFEKISQSNFNFLQTGKLKSEDELKFNDMNALWLIYFFQDYLYNFFIEHNPHGLSQLSSSLEFSEIWKAFYKYGSSEAIYQWPTEFNAVAKIN